LGQHIDAKDIRKHKNDVARLAALLTGNEICAAPSGIRNDMAQFIEAFDIEPPDTKSLGLVGVSSTDISSLLKRIFL
jgi:hypothetical protein